MVKEPLVKLVILLNPLWKLEVKLEPPEHLLKMLKKKLSLLVLG